jgi:hypothetical protein
MVMHMVGAPSTPSQWVLPDASCSHMRRHRTWGLSVHAPPHNMRIHSRPTGSRSPRDFHAISINHAISTRLLISGDLHTLDASKRIHYTVLMGEAKAGTPYVSSNYCSEHKEPCQAGSSCCMLQNSTASGYCYSVTDCSQIPPAGADPLAAPAYIVGVGLDDGAEVTKTPICSLEPSPKTVNASCPWSIEVDSPK